MTDYDVLLIKKVLLDRVKLHDFCYDLVSQMKKELEIDRQTDYGSEFLAGNSKIDHVLSLLKNAGALGEIGEIIWQLVQYLNRKPVPPVNLANWGLKEQLVIFEHDLRSRGESRRADTVRELIERLWPTIHLFRHNPSIDILHLSDLHFGSLEDAGKWHAQIAQDLKYQLQCERLDGLIISGDLTQRSTVIEYAAAVEFLGLMSQEFGLDGKHIVIVPGNHDLNWDLSEQAYCAGDHRGIDAADDTERRRWFKDATGLWMRDEKLYRKRFDLFSKELYEKIKGVSYPSDYPNQFSIQHWPELGLLVVGFNSAWETDHHYRARASIHPLAVTGVINALLDKKNEEWARCVKLAVWHHPLMSPEDSRITDDGFLELLAQAGFRLALHGHIHKADTHQYRLDLSRDGRKLDIIAAGTFGAPSHEWVPGYPLQYNLLRFAEGKLCVETRRREKQNGAWKPDARWLQGAGQDPLPRYRIDL